MGNTRDHSRSSGREREIQEIVSVVWEGNRKTQILLPLSRTETGSFKVLLIFFSFSFNIAFFLIKNLYNKNQ